jgi:hypothetical protein
MPISNLRLVIEGELNAHLFAESQRLERGAHCCFGEPQRGKSHRRPYDGGYLNKLDWRGFEARNPRKGSSINARAEEKEASGKPRPNERLADISGPQKRPYVARTVCPLVSLCLGLFSRLLLLRQSLAIGTSGEVAQAC